MNKQNSRYFDLGDIEDARDTVKNPELKEHLDAILVQVYESSKDPVLEFQRKKLEKVLIKKVEAYRSGDLNKIIEVESEINAIRDSIIKYCDTPEYQEKMYKAIQRVSGKEADIYYSKEVLKNGRKNNKARTKSGRS